ncbi:MAG: hypothetical protein MUC48_24905 [Leptolyngbya sp. Prado105]|jgi:hypothetical protein|nr:hypothetical protein [Leptolyngbya sp. Prado105]
MNSFPKIAVQSLIFAAPIVFGSTVAILPSRAATFAGAGAEIVLENFNRIGNPDSIESSTNTRTRAIASSPGSVANAETPLELNTAIATPEKLTQSSVVFASGSGTDYLADAKSKSETGIMFDAVCGCFRFDFQADLLAFVQADLPSETARAKSFVAFYIFNNNDLSKPIDFLEASFSSDNLFNFDSSSHAFVTESSIDPLLNALTFNGYYARKFEQGTRLTVRSVAQTEAFVAAGTVRVPEPSMIAVFGILPGLIWLKRRSNLKPVPQNIQN